MTLNRCQLFAFLIAFAAVLVTGCTAKVAKSENIETLRSSCFDVDSQDATLHILFGRPKGEDSVELFYVRSEQGTNLGAEIPIPITHAVPDNHHRGNDPQIAARGNRLIALWTALGGGPYGSGPIGIALSDDGGKTWRPGPTPTPDADAAKDVGYRFPAVAADDKSFHVVWIHAEDKERSLRHSRLDFGATKWTDPTIIDGTSCACCWNELKVSATGKLVVLYRDEEPKDMRLAASDDAGRTWTTLSAAGDFGWKFEGCPHIGGGLALIDEKNICATVWTGHPEHDGAYALFSNDGGQSWQQTFKLQFGDTEGRRSDTAVVPSGRGAVVWDQQTETEQGVYIALTKDHGKTWSPAMPLSESPLRSVYPRIVACGDRLIALWTEQQEKETPVLRIENVTDMAVIASADVR